MDPAGPYNPYPVVKQAHVVPRFWLAKWADRNQRVLTQLIREEKEAPVAVSDAATRGPFYRRTRPDGTPIDDVEASLAKLESATADPFARVGTDWPISETDREALTELFAFQLVRGPRWKQWHNEFADKEIARRREDPVMPRPSGLLLPITAKTLNSVEDEIKSDTFRLRKMLALAPKLMTLLSAMTWEVVDFVEDTLVLGDHPVVEWPFGDEPRSAQLFTGHGISNVLEIRIPVTPRRLLVMSWQDEPDGGQYQGTVGAAANANTFSIAHSERQWFKPAGVPVAVDTRTRFDALVRQLHPRYATSVAEASHARSQVQAILGETLGKELENGKTTLVRVTRRGS